jgi:hypothetical protein
MFLFILGGKNFEKLTCQEEYSLSFIKIIIKFHTVGTQHSKTLKEFAD